MAEIPPSIPACTEPGCPEPRMQAQRQIGRGKNPDRMVTLTYPKCRTHWSRQFSEPRKPDRFIDSQGYVKVRVNGKLTHEHRVVMERKIGRQLLPGEHIGWKDNDRTNNAPDNLILYGVVE